MIDVRKQRISAALSWAFPGMQPQQIVTFYLIIPIAIGAVLGWYRAGYAADYPLAVSLFEWTANFFFLWIAFELGSRLAAFLLRPWTAPLWVILIIGGVAGVAISRPVRNVVRDVSQRLAPGVNAEISFPAGLVWEEYVFAYASVVAVPIMIWVIVNYVYARALGVRRYASATDVELAQSGPAPDLNVPPEFAKRLNAGPKAEIYALQAEDHYLRVYTDSSNELIRYRFSDAVGEVRHLPGLQVHRSFWINTDAVDSVRRSGRSYEIVLKGGLEVPVSRSYRYAVKESGLLRHRAS